MKICLVSAGFNMHGGVERYTVELARYFSKEKHEVHVVTSKYEARIEGVIPYELPGKIPWPQSLKTLEFNFFSAKYVEKLDKKENFDIIHAGGLCPSDVATAHSCHKAGIKKWNLASRRDCVYLKYLFYRFAREALPANLLTVWLEKKSYETSKKVISVSKKTKQELIYEYGVPEEKIVVIPPGVSLSEFKPNRRKRIEIRKRYGLSPEATVLLFVGHEFKRKGLKYLLAALPLINRDVKLLVVGKGDPTPYYPFIRDKAIENRVIFTGFVPEVSPYYTAADIFVFPTIDDAFPVVTLQAMASGLAPIISKEAGSSEIITEGYNGFILENPWEAKEIARKVNLLVEDEALRRRISLRAQKTASKYSWGKIAEETMKVYEEVATK